MQMNNFVQALFGLIQVYILYDFYKSFFELREKLKNNWLRFFCLLFITIALFLINSMENAFINLLFVPMLYLFFINSFFIGNLFVKFLYFMISYCLLWGCEFLFVILLKIPPELLVDSSFTEYSSIPIELFAMNLFTYILFSVAKQIPKDVKRRMDIKIFLLYLLAPIASLGIMILVYYSGIDFVDNIALQIILIICLGLMTLGNILVFYGFNRYSESMELSVQQKLIISKQEMDLKYYEKINAYNNKHKEFIHNTNHYLKAIGELASNKQDEKILSILEELQVELEQNETFIYCGNPIINAILSEHKTQAEKADIKYDAYIEPGVLLSNVTDADLIIMLGNLIDNAITAAQKCIGERNVFVRIFMQNEGNFCVVKIANDYCEEIKMENGKIITTKRDRECHGIGIESVTKKAEKYGGYLENIIESRRFTAVLILPITKTASQIANIAKGIVE